MVTYVFRDRSGGAHEYQTLWALLRKHHKEIDPAPNMNFILRELIPFQVFITGETVFKDVFVKSHIHDEMALLTHKRFDPTVFGQPFDPSRESKPYTELAAQIEKCLQEQCDSFRTYSPKAAALSGGLDSGLVTSIFKPEMAYTGFYDGDEFDERDRAGDVWKMVHGNGDVAANKSSANHTQVFLTQEDFLACLNDFMCAAIVPVAGMGSVMEYATQKAFIKDASSVRNVGAFLFGNGGDEYFFGYYYHHFMAMFESMMGNTKWMPNFARTGKEWVQRFVPAMIMESFYRAPQEYMGLFRVFGGQAHRLALGLIHFVPSLYQKLMVTASQYTLTSLLHMNQAMCVANGVLGFNPISSPDIFRMMIAAEACYGPEMSQALYMSPKAIVRKTGLASYLPESVLSNNVKSGFPMPLHMWDKVQELLLKHWENFFYSRGPVLFPQTKVNFLFPGVNRFSWGVLMADYALSNFYQATQNFHEYEAQCCNKCYPGHLAVGREQC